jgi:hypothetical protein
MMTKMKTQLKKEIADSIKEIETLQVGILNNLKQVSSANLSHRVCFSKYLASAIGIECKRLRAKIKAQC